MKYKNIRPAQFISRPNRFIANIEIDGRADICHVKNTGRLKELLVPEARVFVQESFNKNRRTKYDLISVYKGNRLINIDSQMPNKVLYEWISDNNLFGDIVLIKPEYTYEDSRFDFYIETVTGKILIEVKGVTLEENGIAMFPDAPTERGVKHIAGLRRCIKDGYDAYIIFIIQMKDVLYFTPNVKTHKAFADELVIAKNQGVKILALDCIVEKNSIHINSFVDVKLQQN